MQQPRNFSLHGAVDLGARQTAAQRRQQAAQTPGQGEESGIAIEVTDETFNTEVVARSRAVPVIVDLWAQWCEPCKQLGPVLEKLAAEAAGAWVLAKVDVDASPQLSAALQVQSIPMVVAVVGGQLVDGFLGALPEAQVREWLGQIMQLAQQLGTPARAPGADAAGDTASNGAAGAGTVGAEGGTRAGLAGAPGGGSPAGAGRGQAGLPEEMLNDPGFRAAQEAMDSGDLDGAAAALERVLAGSPGHPVATAWLAQIDLIRRVNSYNQAKVRQAARDRPDDPEAQARAADLDLAAGQVEASFDRLLRVFQRTTGQDRDKARLHLLSLFEVLPPRDPNVAKARAKLSSMLF